MAVVSLVILVNYQMLIEFGRPARHRSGIPSLKVSHPQSFNSWSFLSGTRVKTPRLTTRVGAGAGWLQGRTLAWPT